MAARKRKAGESFEAYRENLKVEEHAVRRHLSGKILISLRSRHFQGMNFFEANEISRAERSVLGRNPNPPRRRIVATGLR